MGFMNRQQTRENGFEFVELTKEELEAHNKIVNKAFFQEYGVQFEIAALETVIKEKNIEINILKQEKVDLIKKFEPLKKTRQFFENKINVLKKLDKNSDNPEIQLKIMEAEENIMKDDTVYQEISEYLNQIDLKIENFNKEIQKMSKRLKTLNKKGE